MAPCGWIHTDGGMPCPTCGVTTAATHLVHLQPWEALKTHPFGVALALGGLYLAVMALIALARKRSFVFFLSWLPLGKIFASGVLLLLLSWLYKFLAHPG